MGKYTEKGKLYYNDKGKQICGAQLPGQPIGTRCKNRTTPEDPRCWKHGRKRARMMTGEGNPKYKDGKFSRVKLPPNLAKRYQQAMNDPEYLSMRSELAIVDGMLIERLETLQDGSSGSSWKDARKQLNSFETAMSVGDTGAMRLAISELRDIVNAGASEYAAREEVLKLIRERQRVSESIQKSIINLRQVVTAEQATVLISRIVDSVKTDVSDERDRARLMGSLIRMLDAPGDQELVSRN